MDDALLGKTIADKYRIDSLILAGDRGNLYDARHVMMDRHVAIKILPWKLAEDRGVVSRFFDQAKSASRINDPNILNVVDFGTDAAGTAYTVYENAGGETLREMLARNGQLPVELALGIVRQIALAFSAAHGEGVIHGNLSGENVFVAGTETGSARVKVLDFGSANALEDTNGQPVGVKFAYLAPELCAGSETADARSDIYSLGALFFEMLAGEPLFSGSKPTDVMMRHIEEPPPPLVAFRRDLPPAVEPIVIKALAKNPEMRYQTADELINDIDAASNDAVNVQVAAASAGSNNIWKTAFVVLAGISLLSVFLIYATSVKQTDPTTQLQPDANGVPVQPINPATGAEEQNLALMPGMLPEAISNSNMMSQPPGTLPGGDGYNPWGAGTAPPPGAPPMTYVAPGGQVYTFDPNNPSQFMPQEGGVILVPVPANTNTAAAKPSPSPKTPAANTNTNTAAPAAPKSTPEVKTAKPSSMPAKTPEKPAGNKPEAGDAGQNH